MKTHLKAGGLDLTPAIETYVNDKLFREVEKFLPDIDTNATEMWVELNRTTQHHHKGNNIFQAEVHLKLPGRVLRATSEAWDSRIAVDQVKEELQEQMKAYKEKEIAKYKRGARLWKKIKNLSPLARFWRKGRIKEEGL